MKEHVSKMLDLGNTPFRVRSWKNRSRETRYYTRYVLDRNTGDVFAVDMQLYRDIMNPSLNHDVETSCRQVQLEILPTQIRHRIQELMVTKNTEDISGTSTVHDTKLIPKLSKMSQDRHDLIGRLSKQTNTYNDPVYKAHLD